MNLKPSILIFLFFALVATLYAQEPYSWQLTDENGLPSMEVYDLFQDSKKYIWIGTDKGICKYNGQFFKYYKHPQEKGTSATLIQEDGLGRIWYKNFNGQLFYIDQDSIHLFEMPDSINLNAYFEYMIDGKEGFGVSYKGAYYYHFDEKKWEKIRTEKSGYFFCKKNENIFFQGSSGISYGISSGVRGLTLASIYKNDSRDSIPIEETRETKIFWLNDTIQVRLYQNKFFWNKGVKNKETNNYFETSNAIYDFWMKSSDSIWIGTSQGIYCITLQKGKYHCYDTLYKDKSISKLLSDHEGNLWISTLRKGVFVIPSLKMNFFNKNNSKTSSAEPNKLIKISGHQLGVGHANGNISIIDLASKNTKNIKTRSNKRITSFLLNTTKDELRAYSFNLKSTLSIKKETLLQEEFYGPAVHTIAIYDKTELLVGNSLVVFTTNLDNPYLDTVENSDFNKKWKYFSFSSSDMRNSKHAYIRQERTNSVWTDQKYPNRFWLGCHDSLFYYQNAEPFVVLDEKGRTIQSLDILQTANGVLWVSTINNGVYGIEDHTVKWHYTIKDGLPSNFCNNLTTDGQKLWISTDKGISYLNPETKEIYTYNKLDGLLTEEIKDLEYLDAKIWVASAKGLMSIDTNYNPINSTVPPIYITGFSINGVDTIVQSTSYELSYAQNSLLIEFEGLSYKSQGKYNYIYRLIGQDSTWIKQPAAAPFVRLEQLRVGTYRFEVKTVNEDGVASEKAAFLVFKINPPFWQTWWFYGLCILAGIGIIVSFVIWRYERIRRQQAIENEINELRAEAVESRMQALQSQMNPHFVFNAMTAIQNYWLQNKTSFALRYHAKFAKLMRFIFDYSNKEAITLKKEIEFLELYTTLEQMRFTQPIEIVWDIEEELLDGDYSIPPLLIQPIIENCFKHGFFHKEAAGQLIIEFKKKDVYLHCHIKDDGVGRAQVQEHQKGQKRDAHRNSGLFVTKQRLAILHKNKTSVIKEPILIHDLSNKGKILGTCVELFIPFV